MSSPVSDCGFVGLSAGLYKNYRITLNLDEGWFSAQNRPWYLFGANPEKGQIWESFL